MRRTIFAAVPLALLALAAPAAAKGGHATTYKAKIVAAADAGSVRGQAKLVDGKRDKVQLQVKGLEAGAGYTWSVRSAAAGEDACGGDAVDAFEYRDITARRKGNSRARARSREFSAEDGASYAVVLTDADGADVACGEFLSKADRRAAKREAAKKEHGRSKHDEQGDDDDASGADEQGDDNDAGDEPEAEDPAGDDGSSEPGDDSSEPGDD